MSWLLLLSCSLKAQFSGGIAAGVSTGAVEIKNVGNGFEDVIEGKNITGYEAGLILKAQFGPVYIKPLALYNYRAGMISFNPPSEVVSSVDRTTNFYMHRISVPVFFGMHIIGPVCIEAGPSYNFLLSTNTKINGRDIDMQQTGLGYRAGAAADFGILVLNLSYEGNMIKNNESKTTFKEPYRIIFGAAIKFK